jgi:hypothetical protein
MCVYRNMEGRSDLCALDSCQIVIPCNILWSYVLLLFKIVHILWIIAIVIIIIIIIIIIEFLTSQPQLGNFHLFWDV